MKKVVFTNGCFDIIHTGHIELLNFARSKGDKLIVAINGDSSVKSIKGVDRPFNSQVDRKNTLENLKAVDEVYIFDELTPENLIKKLRPDVLVKGGDWKESEIIGADFVKKSGGDVYTFPLKKGYSTSNLVKKINNDFNKEEILTSKTHGDYEVITKYLENHLDTIVKLEEQHKEEIKKSAEIIIDSLKKGKKILLCGNGGSAADSQHIATELVCRYEKERKALPAIALTTDTSLLTATSNDYSFGKVFQRQVEALANKGDVLVAISTSGDSENVINAVMEARNRGCRIIGMTGENGKKLASLSDVCVKVPNSKTSQVQETHITVAHIWCELIDSAFNK